MQLLLVIVVVTGNSLVTLFVSSFREASAEMNPVRAALLSFLMISAIAICGVGIYASDASSGHAVVDGYGISAIR